MDPGFSTRVTNGIGRVERPISLTFSFPCNSVLIRGKSCLLLLYFSLLICGKSSSSLVYLFHGSIYFSPEVIQEEFLSFAMCVGAFARAMPAARNHNKIEIFFGFD